MKKSKVVIFIILAHVTIASAQLSGGAFNYRGTQGGQILGGFGFSKINDETFYSVQFRPEFAIGQFGVGLNVNLLYNTDTGHIRSEDWNETYDYFRVIRYLRWGQKYDPLYTRVGTLDAARLGHGFIVNYYTNEASYDNRKIGLALDIDFGKFGFESIASNLGRAELIGVRGYYRPLLGIINVPVIKNFAFGVTLSRDFDPDEWSATDDAVSVYGFDLELPIIRSRIVNTVLYYDWAKIHGYSASLGESQSFGNGQAVGVSLDFGNLAGLIDLYAKIERRWLGEEFVPSFFDPFYEIERYQMNSGFSIYKTDRLLGLTESTRGVFGELYGGLLGNKIRLLGMLSRLDDKPKSGMMHLAAEALDTIPGIAVHAMYDKMAIETVDDVFTLDNHSVARVGVGYKLKPYLILFMDYIWTFEETEPGSNIYRPQERVEPKLVFAYQF
jgi:hypothetical protein